MVHALDFLQQYGYVGMFLAAFLAASLLPLPSEAVYTGLIAAGLDEILILVVAVAGNTLGSMTTYYLGLLGKTEWLSRIGVSEEKIERAKQWVSRYGVYAGFFSFVPVIGDALVVVLGFMRAKQLTVWLSVFLGKLVRYGVLALCLDLIFSTN